MNQELIKNQKDILIRKKPKPQELQEDSILIRVVLGALCRTDIYVARGIIRTQSPLVLGHEVAGYVEALGANVSGFCIGDRVGVNPIIWSSGEMKMLGLDYDGCFATYIVIRQKNVYQFKSDIPYQHIAFFEPIAAGLAVTQCNLSLLNKGLIVGENRIAKLTKFILQAKGYKQVEIIKASDLGSVETNSIDFIIETELSKKILNTIIKCLKPKAKLILKSRRYSELILSNLDLVKKEVVIQGAFYGSFNESQSLIQDKMLDLDSLCGDKMALQEVPDLIMTDKALEEDKKLFIQF